MVSRKGIILQDPWAEKIWSAAGFPLKGKSASKWLAYYMGIRAAVFDAWVAQQMASCSGALVLHIGCGLDSRAQRVASPGTDWYDVDFPEVICQRERFYARMDRYHMIGADTREADWLQQIPGNRTALVVMEGVSMYFRPEELRLLLARLSGHFAEVRLLMDCYTVLAARASRYKNPIRDVGVTQVWGLDDPRDASEGTGLVFLREWDMIPARLAQQLEGMERSIFRTIFAGGLAKRLYRLYEYRSENCAAPENGK